MSFKVLKCITNSELIVTFLDRVIVDIDIDVSLFERFYYTETAPSLWDVEFAKQLAAMNEQPFQNGFEEMMQWTKEGILWEFPINNEAGKF